MDNLNFEDVKIPLEQVIEQQESQPAPPPKKGRGRPRKDGSQTTAKNQEPSIDELKKQVEKKEKEFEAVKEALATEEAKPENNPFAGLIDGYMVILVMNVVFPSLIKLIFAKKFKEITHEDIALNGMQQESIKPLADHVANYITQFINPLVAFALVSSLMYYQNASLALEMKTKK